MKSKKHLKVSIIDDRAHTHIPPHFLPSIKSARSPRATTSFSPLFTALPAHYVLLIRLLPGLSLQLFDG